MGNGCTCTRTYKHGIMSMYTHSLAHAHTFNAALIHSATNTRPQGSHLKDRLSGIITLAKRRLAFSLKDSIVLLFLADGRGGELNGIPSPGGTAKAKQC